MPSGDVPLIVLQAIVKSIAESFYSAISFLAINKLPEYYLLLAKSRIGVGEYVAWG